MSIETFFTCMKGVYERKVSIKLNLSAKVFNLLKESIPAYDMIENDEIIIKRYSEL